MKVNDLNDKHFTILRYLNDKGISDRHCIISDLNNSDIQEILIDLFKHGFIHLDKNRTWIIENGVKKLFDYDKRLADLTPTITPIKEAKKTHINTTHKGTTSKNMWKSEAILYLVYPLLVLLIGTVILKILKVI